MTKPSIRSLKTKHGSNSELTPKPERAKSSDSAESGNGSSSKPNQQLSPKPAPPSNAAKTATPQKDSDAPTAAFQAVGVIKGEVSVLSDEKGTITIAGKNYPLLCPHYLKRRFRMLKKEIEQSGKAEQRLIVYPQVFYFSDEYESYQVCFAFVRFDQGEKKGILNTVGDMEFMLAGLWQWISKCSIPCVSIFKNSTPKRVNRIKQMNPISKVRFLHANHLPLLWEDAPVEPKPSNSETSPMFVNVKARFNPEKDVFEFVSSVAPPLEKPPKFLQASEEDKKAAAQAKQEKKKQTEEGLTGVALAQRLGVSSSTVGTNSKKGKEAFMAWTRGKDPEGLAWERRDEESETSQKKPKPRYFVVTE
ncbi:MAG: hypothetical protein ABEI32_09050 [Halothece sp.]